MTRTRSSSVQSGYTLVELIVAAGLFAFVMVLASGAYLIMIGVNRQAQSIAVGIDNLSFALETMTRTIRTGRNYRCDGGSGNCPLGGTSFLVTNEAGNPVTYALASGVITQDGVALTDPTVNITSLTFYTSGTATATAGEYTQPRVVIVVAGSIPYASGKTESFAVETQATMRGSDL